MTRSALPDASDYVVTLTRGDRALFDTIAMKWSALCDEGPCASVFFRPEWVTAYVRAWYPDAPIALLTVRRDGALRGVLPFIEHRPGIGPFRLRWLRVASTVNSGDADLIHGAGDMTEVVEAVRDHLDRATDWDVLHCRSTCATGAFEALAERCAAEGAPVARQGETLDWYLPTPSAGTDLEAAIADRPRSLRKQLRRDLRRLRTMGTVAWVTVTPSNGQDAVRAALADFYTLERSGWKGSYGGFALGDPGALRFYDELIERDLLIVHRLEVDGTLLATMFGTISGKTYLCLRTTHDEAYRSVAPGHLIILLALTDVANRGCTVLDLGPSTIARVSFKQAWTDRSYAASTRLIFRANWRGRALHMAIYRLAPLVRSHLPRVGPLARFSTRS